jgi:thiamine biosynthesis lipoprotein
MNKFLVFRKPLFGKEIEVVVYNVDKNVKKVLNEMYSEALRLQKIFNFFDEESELSILNKKRKLKVSPELLYVLKNALKFSNFTKGKYDISFGKNILLRKQGKEIENLNCSYKDIITNGNEVILKNENVLIDLGSIAKGYITDKLAEFLILNGVKEFLIDSRGDIIFSGNNFHIIGVKHPRKNENFLEIKLQNQAVATSGDYLQFDKTYEKSHILNSKEIISVTVISQSLEEADVLATALFVSEEKERNRLIKKNKNAKILLIDNELNYKMFNGFSKN